MQDNSRLQELDFEEARELLSPGCLEMRRKCRYCNDEEISSRAQRLVELVGKLRKRKVFGTGYNQTRFPRFRRKNSTVVGSNTGPSPHHRDLLGLSSLDEADHMLHHDHDARPGDEEQSGLGIATSIQLTDWNPRVVEKENV